MCYGAVSPHLTTLSAQCKEQLTSGKIDRHSFLRIIIMIIVIIIDKIRKLFEVIKYSERGSNAYTKETATIMMFVDFLDECEKG